MSPATLSSPSFEYEVVAAGVSGGFLPPIPAPGGRQIPEAIELLPAPHPPHPAGTPAGHEDW